MNINVPATARAHFWEEPPADSMEFWSFRYPPPCAPGDTLYFRFDGVIVARALVDRIERPGKSICEATGKYLRGWKVYWTPESFSDLRAQPAQIGGGS